MALEASALTALGHRVSVEARRRSGDSSALAPKGVPVSWVEDETRPERLRALLWVITRHPLRALADVRGQRARVDRRGVPLRQLAPRARRLARLTPAVHLHTHFATVDADEAHRIARVIGAPTSLTAHAYDIYLRPDTLAGRLRRSHFSTSGCDYTVAHLREVAGPDHAQSIFKQIMGVDPSAFERSAPLPGGRHVAAVGRLVEKKGFIHLVRAAARLPDVTISIAGEGPERGRLEAEIGRLGVGDRVSLLGALPQAGIRALLERADLLCMPCVVAADGDRDSMPVVVKEAMAMQLCVVASDEVGLPELVEEPWGRLVRPGDHDGLADAIGELLAQDPERRRELGAMARTHVARIADVHTETGRLSGWIADAQSGPLGR
ncbi:MAG TPA: glycosyltransferase [Thermoleophilaceae bacterium]|nr:glycosyltransferase [Thermoleophilaceae bacterium]